MTHTHTYIYIYIYHELTHVMRIDSAKIILMKLEVQELSDLTPKVKASKKNLIRFFFAMGKR